MALGVIRTVGEWLPRAVADGSDLEARSQMLMASHLAGVGQASGTGVGLVHALGHALGTRGRLPHGTALAVVLPGGARVLPRGARAARPRAGAGRRRAAGRVRRPSTAATAAGAAVGELRRFLAPLGQRPRLRTLGFDETSLDVVAPGRHRRRGDPQLAAPADASPRPRDPRGRVPRLAQPPSTSGLTSPTNRSSVSTSYGAGCSEITVRKPSSTYGPEPVGHLLGRPVPERVVVLDLGHRRPVVLHRRLPDADRPPPSSRGS